MTDLITETTSIEDRQNILNKVFNNHTEVARAYLHAQPDYLKYYNSRFEELEKQALKETGEEFLRDNEETSSVEYYTYYASANTFNKYIALVEKFTNELQNEIEQTREF